MWKSMLQEAYFHSTTVPQGRDGTAQFDNHRIAKNIIYFQD